MEATEDVLGIWTVAGREMKTLRFDREPGLVTASVMHSGCASEEWSSVPRLRPRSWA